MILVELRVERIDLALAVGVIERVVDCGRRNAQARCSHAIDREHNGLRAGLLIGGDVLNIRQAASA